MKTIMMIAAQIIVNILLQSIFVSQHAQAKMNLQTCTPSESWSFETSRQSTSWQKHFKNFLSNQDSPWNSFSEAIQLRKMSQLMNDGSFEADFSEYWIGRIFYSLKLYPLAQNFFESSAQNASHSAIRNASSDCMKLIGKKMPDWNKSKAERTQVQSIHLQKAVDAMSKRDFKTVVNELNLELQSPSGDLNFIHLLMGRALYSMQRFPEAIQHFQKISRRSNLIIDGLTDLSWAYLLNENPAESLGIAIQLRSGALKNTFSPESLMVAAMALNETCSYPDAVKMIQLFIQDYQPSFEWLAKNSGKGINPYQEILNGLKQGSTVPSKIRTEWSRSASFQVRQEEINLLIENTRFIAGVPSKIKRHKEDLAKKQSTILDTLIRDLQKPVKNQAAREKLAKRVLQSKREVRRIIRLTQSMKVLTHALKKFEATLPAEKSRMVELVNRDLAKRNSEMLALLKRVRENIDLVEVEIYHGASKDLLKGKSAREAGAETAPKQEGALAWNWGRFSVTDMDQIEVWEDELGAMKADIQSHCQ